MESNAKGGLHNSRIPLSPYNSVSYEANYFTETQKLFLYRVVQYNKSHVLLGNPYMIRQILLLIKIKCVWTTSITF